jgi:two-component system NtrC family sensor kinase
MTPRLAHNTRILLIDDMPSIHEDFRKILAPEASPALPGEEAVLGRPCEPARRFELDSAYGGEEGVALAEAALRAGQPYAVAFVDMRMPAGWDGVQTIARLWAIDPRLQVVICTAYSDQPWDEVLQQLEVEDRLLVVKKPFDMIEVSQVAQTLTMKWSIARQSDEQLRQLESTVRQLRASESQLRHARGELQAFAHAVAHDLNSPIAIVRAFVGLLAEEIQGAGETTKACHYLHRIRTNVEVAQDLLSGLVTLTQIARAELRPEDIDLAQIVQQHVAELRHASPHRAVQVTVQPGLRIRADRRLMQTALRNLVENAWKFSSRREAGVIEVGAAQETPEHATYFVRDNGCGFDMAHAPKLFQTFGRLHADEDYPGTGVGLVTVQRVLERHGGSVWARSAPGEGSTFFFTLPRAPVAPATQAVRVQEAET